MLQAEVLASATPEKGSGPDSDAAQQLGGFAAASEISDGRQAMTAPDIATGAPEKPVGHPDVDPKTLSAAALIKVCPYYAKIAETNPEHAETEATKVVERMQERQTMRENGVSEEVIEDQKWSAMRERFKEKAKASERVAPEQNVPEALAVKTPDRHMAVDGTLAVSAHEPPAHRPPPQPKVRTPDSVKPSAVKPVQKIPDRLATVEYAAALSSPARPKGEPLPRPAVVRAYETAIPPSPTVGSKYAAVPEKPILTVQPASRNVPPEPAVEIVEPGVENTRMSETLPPGGTDEPGIAVIDAAEATALADLPDIARQAEWYGGATDPLELIDAQEFLARPPLDRPIETDPGDSAYPEHDLMTRIEATSYDGIVEAEPTVGDVADGEAAIVPPLPTAASEVIEYDAMPLETAGPMAWSQELNKEPLALYEDFTRALYILADAAKTEPVTDGEAPPELVDTQLTEHEQATEIQTERERMPVIAMTVAERLSELSVEERAAVAPILQNIVTEIAMVSETDAVKPEAIETAAAEPEEYVTLLLEQLGIVCEPEDVSRLIRMLLRPDFRPPQPGLTEAVVEVDLEHEGTHEAILYWPRAVAALLADDEQHDVTPALASFALLRYMAKQPRPDYRLAA